MEIEKTDGLSRRSFVASVGIAVLGIAASAFLSACGANGSTESSGSSSTTASSASGQGKVLVAYYSAQGHTKIAAETAAVALGADTFIIMPANPYSEADLDFNDDASRVSREHEDETIRDLLLTENAPANFGDYDTVLIGYPIWWSNAAWPMWDFAIQNDFTGKTVVPFCTSYSSSLGSSGTNLAALAGTGDWRQGLRFDQEVDTAEVEQWAKSLNL